MKRAAWITAGALALLAVAVGTLAWLATTANGFRWLAQTVAAASGGRLALEGVDGHLGAPINIGRLTFSDEFRRVEIEGVRLEWRPRALWQRRLDIDLLAAQTLRVTTLKPDPTPLALPASLRVPLDVTVRTLDVATLEVVDAGRMHALRTLRARLDGRGDRYRLAQVAADTPWAALRGEFEIGKDAPFAVRGSLDAKRPAPLPVAARLALGGTLAAPVFRLDAAAEGMSDGLDENMAMVELDAEFRRLELQHVQAEYERLAAMADGWWRINAQWDERQGRVLLYRLRRERYTDRVLLALEALKVAGLQSRADLYATLHCCLIDRAEHRLLFDQAFRIFFRRRGLLATR